MQFGSTLQRLLQRLVYANKLHGPPLITKINLADSYYRVPLNPSAALALAVVIPSDTTEQSLIALPLVLPMGWAHSPPPPTFVYLPRQSPIWSMPHHLIIPPSTHIPYLWPLNLSPLNNPLHNLYQKMSITPLSSLFCLMSHLRSISCLPPIQNCDIYIYDFITITQQPNHEPFLNH